MNWLRELLKDNKTFDQELELLIARWTDMSRKKEEALTAQEIGRRLIFKGRQIGGEK